MVIFIFLQNISVEHKIYKFIRKYKIPFFIRVIITAILCFLWIISIILPLPFSVPIWIILIAFWAVFIISAKDIKSIIKIRKGTMFLTKNIVNKKIRDQKIKDIKKHVRQILNNPK